MKVDLERLIERWENGLRVLKAMDPHEREKHFNMALWGKKTDCGTLACAAGHMSLDPWFRRRGFASVWRPPQLTRSDEETVIVLDPTQDRAWSEMINQFFYSNDRAFEDHYAGDFSELEQLAHRATQVLYDGRQTYGEVVAHIEGTIKRLKEYRDRVKKADPTTVPAGV